VILAVVWGYDTGAAVAAVVTPRPLTIQQLLAVQPPPRPHIAVIPTRVQYRVVLQ
jgi:hypothetical protein